MILLLGDDGFISVLDSRNLKFDKSFLLQISHSEIEQDNLTFQNSEDVPNLKVVKIFPFNENTVLASFQYGFSFVYDLQKTSKILYIKHEVK